ncbi:ABC transporter permease [Granulicatella sp. zg-ZJ]|uniref:ABC transporter permease n=1 Tax=unclassified Granulicatella TaxID=2630493 RepID=UPI0013C1C5B1|nr:MULTISPECIES: ABC transporter permease [unclassified Granulicatella]MBS4751092.1 ABC transporter permease [Carnobacteriaceae bacterium zg-ZUI78]NEW62913.1 ABC transporter permease [Granulicatella sp. zg-ZJ]NEW65836.1 ABC transporter permease [Granulicatella sp. zg-84]QMI86373.1 ABC transporter permease [Carnobacteriaceae bacterium zg-84]
MNHVTFVLDILYLAIQLSIPIVLGALCGTIAERSGVILLGVEGLMLFGSFFGVLGVYLTNNPWIGVIASIVIGGLMGLLYGVFVLRYRAQQSVVGVGFNFLGSGVTAVLLKMIWDAEGLSTTVQTVPTVTIPILSDIPFINRLFLDQSPYLYFMVIIVAATYIIMYKTKVGLRLRAMGENPYAVQTAGISVNRYRYIALMISGMIAGLAGSFLSISQNNLFVTDMVAGRGFMGLAANIFGGWHPLGSLGASFIFSTAQAVRFKLVDASIPTHLISLLPYMTTLFVLLVVGLKSKTPTAPEGLGKLVD